MLIRLSTVVQMNCNTYFYAAKQNIMATQVKKEKQQREPKKTVAKKDKVINLNYYQLYLDNLETKTVNAEAIRNAFKKPPKPFVSLPRIDDESRVGLKGRALQEKENGIIYGTLIHTQTKDLPFASHDLTDTYQDLTISEDAGLGYPTSFLYDPEVNIVMIESVKNGVGIGTFCKFFEMNLSLPHLDCAIVINPSGLQKLNSMQRISRFQYKVARLQSGNAMRNEKNAVGGLISAADSTGNDVMEVILTSSRSKKSSLAKEVIKGMAESVMKYISKDNKDVKKLIVTGSIDGFTDQVDLIKQRVKSEIKVELLRNNSLASIGERYNALYSAYVENKSNLHKAYKV